MVGAPLQCEPANSKPLTADSRSAAHANPCATDGTDIRPTPLEAVRLPIFGNPNAQWDGAGLEQDVGRHCRSPAADPDHRDHGGDHPLAVVRILNRVIRRMADGADANALGETRRAERTQELSEVLMNHGVSNAPRPSVLCCDPYSPATVVIIALLLILPILGISVGHCWPARACWVLLSGSAPRA